MARVYRHLETNHRAVLIEFQPRKGYRKVTQDDKRTWHRAGGLARVANGRDELGRFVPVVQE